MENSDCQLSLLEGAVISNSHFLNRELIRQKKELFTARQKRLLNEIKIAGERVHQRGQDIKEIDKESIRRMFSQEARTKLEESQKEFRETMEKKNSFLDESSVLSQPYNRR